MGIKNVLKKTGMAAATAVFCTGILAVEGTKQVIKGAKAAKDAISDSIDKGQEIKRISKYCEELQENLNNMQQAYEAAYNREAELYSEQCGRIIEKAKIIGQYQNYLNKKSTALTVSNDKFQWTPFDTGVSPEGVTIAASSLAQGAVAGAAAGAGAAGLMALFGTASTGTAISSLSGAAFTNALLASLGGGAISAGGAGILGGTIVLGSLVTVPAVLVGGKIAVKKINEKYAEAKQAERDAMAKEELCGEIFAQYEEAIAFMRRLNYSFNVFGRVFSKTVSQLSVAADSGRAELIEKNDRIIEMGVDIINEFLSMSLVDDINQPIFSGELNDLIEDKVLDYSSQFALYQQEMTKAEQEIARQFEGAAAEDFSKEVEKTAAMKAELKKAPQIIDEQQKLINAAEKEGSAEMISEAASDFMAREMPAYCASHLQKAQERYSLFKNESIVEAIANAEFQYDICKYCGASDFSPVVLEYSKAIEYIVKYMADMGILTADELTGTGKTAEEKTLGELCGSYIGKNREILGSDLVKNFNSFIKIRNAAIHRKIISIEKAENARRLAATKSKGAIIPILYRKLKKAKVS